MKQHALIWLLALASGVSVIGSETAFELVAGTGAAENNGDAAIATNVNIGHPFGVELGPDGALYITEVAHHRVRRLDLSTNELTTVAGCGRRGYSGDSGPAVAAELNEPYEVRFDSDGNMYIVEMRNHLIRRVDAETKTISTIAGTGQKGFGGDEGPAIAALLNQPHSIALDSKGAVYIADIGNHRIRRVDPKTGLIETIAGNSRQTLPQDGQLAQGNSILGPRALFIQKDILWIALREGHSIWRMKLSGGVLHRVAGTGESGFGGDGGLATEAILNGPKGIAVALNGNVYVADTENNSIRRIDIRSGVISTVGLSSTTNGGRATDNNNITTTHLNKPHGVCVSPNGTLFIGDTENHRVCRVSASDL
jgi:streptogramin lyase